MALKISLLKSICVLLHLCSTVSGQALVLDGDTIMVEGIRVRLIGIDAEELIEPHGLDAKRHMQVLVNGSTIICKLTGERSYERYIGRCYRNSDDLAVAMVSQGKALDCAHYSHGEYRKYEPANARSYLIQKPYC